MGTLALRVTGGRKDYLRDGRVMPVLAGIDLAVEEGEVLALLGPSGCGKSTLLRAIAGLESFTAGQVEVIPDAEQHRRIGMVFQDPLLLPWLTVAGNVTLGLHYAANRAARAVEAVDHLLHDLGLGAIAGAYPAELSGGQAQRVSLARTLIIQPRVLLLDEPFSALDPRTRAALQAWLLEITRRRRLTVIVVTHDVDEALFLGDRIALMSRTPGTITHVWPLRQYRAGDGRWQEPGMLQRVRQEILAQYQTDVPLEQAPPNWVI